MTRPWPIVAALLCSQLACSSAEVERPRHRRVDRMHFVDDQAVEPIAAPRRRKSDARGAARRPAGPALTTPGTTRRRPRCANTKSGPSVSVGRATAGRLADGCEFPERGTGWVRRNRDGWGTDQTVALLQWGIGRVVRRHPGTALVIVGALSRRRGGRLGRHKSHQSGRDADIGYYATDNRQLPHFRNMGPGNFDAAKNWILLRALLSTGRVQYIFMDYNLQAMLVRHLQDEGASPVMLARTFQYPAGRGVRRGIIRHARGHRDHFHIRFRCAEDDDRCED